MIYEKLEIEVSFIEDKDIIRTSGGGEEEGYKYPPVSFNPGDDEIMIILE